MARTLEGVLERLRNDDYPTEANGMLTDRGAAERNNDRAFFCDAFVNHRLAFNTPEPIEQTAMRRLAATIDLAVIRNVIDSRSAIADARLEVGDPYTRSQIKKILGDNINFDSVFAEPKDKASE